MFEEDVVLPTVLVVFNMSGHFQKYNSLFFFLTLLVSLLYIYGMFTSCIIQVSVT